MTQNKELFTDCGSLHETERVICPYMDQPFEDCWFKRMTSQDIIKVVSLCGGSNFKGCEIYRKHHQASCERVGAEELCVEASGD